MSLVPPFTIHINSNQRLSGSHSNFSYRIPILPNNKFDRVCLTNGAIPKTWYLLNDNVNTSFILSESSDVTVTLDEGNYSIKSIAAQLSSKMTEASPSGWTYHVTYPSSTEAQTTKLKFNVIGNASFQPSITFSNSLNYALGFAVNSTNTFTSDILISTNVILLTINEVYIKSDLITASSGGDTNQILAESNVLNNPFNTTIGIHPSDVLYHSRPFHSTSNVFTFTLTDSFNNIIDLNGNIPISLQICFFKFDSSSAVLKKRAELQWLEQTMRN